MWLHGEFLLLGTRFTFLYFVFYNLVKLSLIFFNFTFPVKILIE